LCNSKTTVNKRDPIEENTSYSQNLHIPASSSDPESLTINSGKPETTVPSKTCHNQEFLIRSSFQIQLTASDSGLFPNSKDILNNEMIILKDLFDNKAEFRNLCTSRITRKCRNSWSFLPIPELQISHGWLSDHLQSLNKCKAEFRNLCISGITRKCRNSWSFLPIPESQINHPHTLTPSHPHRHTSPSNW